MKIGIFRRRRLRRRRYCRRRPWRGQGRNSQKRVIFKNSFSVFLINSNSKSVIDSQIASISPLYGNIFSYNKTVRKSKVGGPKNTLIVNHPVEGMLYGGSVAQPQQQ